jgi:glycosyltransferase involved in cell wall biosynthesis
MDAPLSHVVLIPSYNTGAKLLETVRDARRFHDAVWVVIDGSTDGSAQALRAMARGDAGIRVMELAQNQGKGAAILHGLIEAVANGYTHVLTMDSDGQHPAPMIPDYIALSRAHPGALILGKPVFDHTAPRERVIGRRICNWWVNLETLHAGIGDSLFGMRVYPARPLLDVMQAHLTMRRFDFDAESAIRLVWRGMRPLNIDTPVRYFTVEEGGVSHFNYLRDNLLLSGMHVRLLLGFLLRLPWLLVRRLRLSAAQN